MPRKKPVLHDRAYRQNAAREIVRDAMNGADGDPLGHLNPLEIKFHPFPRTGVFVPTADDVPCRRALLFLADEIPHLIAQMDRLPDQRSKLLLARTTLQKWNQAFHRMVKPKPKSNQGLD
jgi:hypothetical protein